VQRRLAQLARMLHASTAEIADKLPPPVRLKCTAHNKAAAAGEGTPWPMPKRGFAYQTTTAHRLNCKIDCAQLN